MRKRRSYAGWLHIVLILGLNLSLAGAAAAALAPDVSATKTDALLLDGDGDGQADPGDTLRYTVLIGNAGDADATGVVLSDTLDANTTLSGTLKTSPLARGDVYTATRDTARSVPASLGLLANDFGVEAPTVVPFGGPTGRAVRFRA